MSTLENSLASKGKLNDNVVGVVTSSHSAHGTDWWRALRKHWIPAVAVTVTVFAGVTLFTLTRTPKYQSETLVLLDKEKRGIALPIDPTSEEGESNDGIATDLAADLSTEIQVLKSRPLIAKALRRLDPSYRSLSMEDVAENLSVSQAGEASVLIVTYTDPVPERAKAVLEALGSTYVSYSLERKRSQAANGIRFIESKLPEAQQELNQSALRIREFRQRYGIVDPNSYAKSVSQTKESLAGKAYEVKADLDLTKRQYQELRRQMAQVGQDPGTALADSVLGQDIQYQKLVDRLGAIEAQYTQDSIRFQDAHPAVQNLRQSRDNTLGLLQHQAKRVLGTKVSQVAAKTSASGEIQQELAKQLVEVETKLAVQTAQLSGSRRAQREVAENFERIPQLQQAYAELERQFELNAKVVDRFMEKLQELKIIEAQEPSPWRILEPPYLPTNPVSPNLQRSLFLGLIAGGLLGVAAAILLERSDERVKGVEETKELTGLPLLGAIPRVDMTGLAATGGETNLLKRHSFQPLTESLRSLALNLRYLGSSGKVKTLAFTSALPAEGKTTVTYYLALVLAELGRRVLLIDADMRKPNLHKLSQLPNASGLSTAIATDRPWRELIHADYMENLDIMTSGAIPPNPVTLLGSEKMTQLLQEWRQVYDFVLIDTPPIVGITDAQSLTSKVDEMILVAAIELSTRSAMTRALELLQGSQASIAGLVVNLLDKGHGDYYYYHYYSSYYGEPPHANGLKNGTPTPNREILANLLRRR